MKQYLDLLREIREHGTRKEQRAVLKSTNTRPAILSVFGRQIRFDLQKGFPLVTTKKMPWAAIVHELIWFLSGSTNIKYLKDNNVKIWDEWADENGELGAVYGKHWRSWEGPQGVVDQISKLIGDIIKVSENPYASEGRRLILSAWNPADMPDPKIPTGCHTLAQFNVTNGFLSCQMYQRSADMFLGVPFNIASYALLLSILAVRTGLKPGEFVHTFGDAHIYENHFEAVDMQIKRTPFRLPTLKIDEEAVRQSLDLKDLKLEYFQLEDYYSYGRLPGEVAV